MKVAIVYCLHGDEKNTEKIAKHFDGHNDVKLFFGNQKAYDEDVRFTESDMNRSFNRSDTYEAKQAERLKKELDEYDADIVVDLHMTKAEMSPSIIITELERLETARLLGISRVIYMTDKFANGGSIIENVKNSVSVELYDDDKDVVETGIRIVTNALTGGDTVVEEFEVFTVEKKVEEEPIEKITNFEVMENGKYPVFYGNTSYKANSGVVYLECRKDFMN